ncbi:MAG TPA: TerC family protein [Bryobacteraceae bacterium]|nr:TerC family protein [Bryobacteraceae bacterium]
MRFLLSVLSLILIDLTLAGDNALVIAMAVRSLPPRERRLGSVGGAIGAVALRVVLTTVAARLLAIPFLQLAGGLFVLWIAVKVMIDVSDPPDAVPSPKRFWEAVWYIMVADLTMSTDNIIAIAGTSKGNVPLIVFGLCVSIPFVVLSSNLLAELMNRFPVTIYLGVAILGYVGGQMALTDRWVSGWLHPTDVACYTVEAALAVAVVAVGWWLARRRLRAVPDPGGPA